MRAYLPSLYALRSTFVKTSIPLDVRSKHEIEKPDIAFYCLTDLLSSYYISLTLVLRYLNIKQLCSSCTSYCDVWSAGKLICTE